jgi:hypothetical protein
VNRLAGLLKRCPTRRHPSLISPPPDIAVSGRLNGGGGGFYRDQASGGTPLPQTFTAAISTQGFLSSHYRRRRWIAGFGKPVIDAMLGDAPAAVKARYVHHLDAVLVAAADRVTKSINSCITENRAKAATIRAT